MFNIGLCEMKNTCYDCNSDRCALRGKKESDCPKYRCDNPVPDDCDNCSFINMYIDMERKRYKEEKYDQDRKH